MKSPTVTAVANLGETLIANVIAYALSNACRFSDEKLGYCHHDREPLVVEMTASSPEADLRDHRDPDHPFPDLNLPPSAHSIHNLLVLPFLLSELDGHGETGDTPFPS